MGCIFLVRYHSYPRLQVKVRQPITILYFISIDNLPHQFWLLNATPLSPKLLVFNSVFTMVYYTLVTYVPCFGSPIYNEKAPLG